MTQPSTGCLSFDTATRTGWSIVASDEELVAYGLLSFKDLLPGQALKELADIMELAESLGVLVCRAEASFKGKNIGTYGDAREIGGFIKASWYAVQGYEQTDFEYVHVKTWRKVYGPEGPKLSSAQSKHLARELSYEKWGKKPDGKKALNTDMCESAWQGVAQLRGIC